MPKYFLYTRKSTDTEDKQVLSLESQLNELNEFIRKEGLEVVEVFPGEAKSAKQPGRPLFDKMIKRIERGEADGIIAWHPDRLARNSVDGGKIIFLMDKGKLVDLKFPTYRFENTPQGKFMLNIFFGQSKYYVDSLSENVKRGNKTKLEKGWLPGIPPLGYLNDKVNHTIVKDPERFRMVRKMWELLLEGTHSVAEIRRIANEEWGLRTVRRRHSGGNKLGYNTLYRLFETPFYYGLITRSDGSFQGSHEPMITVSDFNRAQSILGRDKKFKKTRREFAFTGAIRCGECGCMITAEHKINRYGAHYTYYHCTKRKQQEVKCSQKCIRAEDLEAQIKEAVGRVAIYADMHKWAVNYLREVNDQEITDRSTIFAAQQKAFNDCQKQLDELTQMRFRSMVSDDEYKDWKTKLLSEKIRLKEKLADTDNRASRWLELSERVFLFAKQAKNWFERGDLKTKRQILESFGSNLLLKDGFLQIEAKKPFYYIDKNSKNTTWLPLVESIRTFCKAHVDDFEVPVYIKTNNGLEPKTGWDFKVRDYYPLP